MSRTNKRSAQTSERPRTSEPKERKLRIDDLASLKPLTATQKLAIEEYRDGKNLMLHGVSGTGKTYLASSLAFEEVLDPSYPYQKVVYVRSAVSTREIGFLKGDEKEKVAVYELPYVAICRELFGLSNSYELLKNQGAVDFISTSFIRGHTFKDTILIVDEFENLNFHELDSIITRPGENCKVIFCGDYAQSDFTKTNEKTGCLDFMKIIRELKDYSLIEFGIPDIVRSKAVKDYIIAKYKLGLHI